MHSIYNSGSAYINQLRRKPGRASILEAVRTANTLIVELRLSRVAIRRPVSQTNHKTGARNGPADQGNRISLQKLGLLPVKTDDPLLLLQTGDDIFQNTLVVSLIPALRACA